MFSTNGTALHRLPVPLSHDAQILFLWLALSADETGHVAIHPGELERAMDDSSEHLEAALHELVTHRCLLRSQIENHLSSHIVSYQTCLRPERA
jgi:hypothetical protein